MSHVIQVVGTFIFIAILLEILLIKIRLDQ
jgi:hypothetical protein